MKNYFLGDLEESPTVMYQKHEHFSTRIKSLRATPPEEPFTEDFAS
jgi:hypothetical protein